MVIWEVEINQVKLSVSRVCTFLFLLIVAQNCFAEQRAVDETQSFSLLEFPIVDSPYNVFPSMSQSLNITKSMYQYAHHTIGQTDWSLTKKRFATIAFDFITTYLPAGDAWLHEEWHRAVMGQYGIDSYNEVYDIPLFAETIAVSGVKDQDLANLKRDHPADMVRLHAAGIESQYQLALALEKDQFYFNSTTWDSPLLWLNYVNNIAYMFTCASNESNLITDDFLKSEDQDISKRDFTGLDCNAWVYDLYRPNEPYGNRGTHPSGVGINRYISYSTLTKTEQKYLKRQSRLSLLNLVSPFLIGKKTFKGFGVEYSKLWLWNSTLRHHLTPFGNNIGINFFAKTQNINLFSTLNYYSNNEKYFGGLDITIIRQATRMGNIKFSTSYRVVLWQQPENLSFYDKQSSLGGLIGVKTYFNLGANSELTLQVSRKTQGWLAGVVELDQESSIKLGLSYMLK